MRPPWPKTLYHQQLKRRSRQSQWGEEMWLF
jgi:hypothetical protein